MSEEDNLRLGMDIILLISHFLVSIGYLSNRKVKTHHRKTVERKSIGINAHIFECFYALLLYCMYNEFNTFSLFWMQSAASMV